MKTANFLSIAGSLLIIAMIPTLNFAQTSSGSMPATKISNDFINFLYNVDSQQVVNDLRNGQWTTTTTDPTTGVTTTTTEALPTGKMGWGNVDNSLALAQHSLSQQGITQPTSEQLYASLMGGEVVPGDPNTMTQGILQMRADGMGWGQIAQQYDTKLGYLKGNGKQASVATTTSTTEKGIIAKGKPSSTNSSLSTVGKGSNKSYILKQSQGKGIVSASGQSAGSSSNFVRHSGGGGRGIVSGSGRSIGSGSGLVTGGGNGHQYGGSSSGGHGNGGGHGKGHNK